MNPFPAQPPLADVTANPTTVECTGASPGDTPNPSSVQLSGADSIDQDEGGASIVSYVYSSSGGGTITENPGSTADNPSTSIAFWNPDCSAQGSTVAITLTVTDDENDPDDDSVNIAVIDPSLNLNALRQTLRPVRHPLIRRNQKL